MKFPRLPKALLKTPRGFRMPKIADLRSDMQRLGEDIAEEFKEKVIENIEDNTYGFDNAESTLKQKSGDTPLIDTGELVSSIYRDGTSVSVKDTKRTDSALNNLELAIVLEYGTKDKHIPARPVWRNTYREFRKDARQRVEKFFETNGKFTTPTKKTKSSKKK